MGFNYAAKGLLLVSNLKLVFLSVFTALLLLGAPWGLRERERERERERVLGAEWHFNSTPFSLTLVSSNPCRSAHITNPMAIKV